MDTPYGPPADRRDAATPLRVVDLRCEHLVDPLGIDVAQPRLVWRVESASRGDCPQGFEVQVASCVDRLEAGGADLWDSGRVDAAMAPPVAYGGHALSSGQRCWWRVRAWRSDEAAGPWSEPARWSMGLLDPAEWRGAWIGWDEPVPPPDRVLPARLLRRAFELPASPRRATAYICGLGYFELLINGVRVGDHVLDPALSEYDRRAYYLTFEVERMLRGGENAIGVILGNGRYFAPRTDERTRSFGYPKLLFQLDIEMADGTQQSIVSDESWRLTTEGPIRANNDYDGEVYDGCREIRGWAGPGFDDAHWAGAQRVEPPGPLLRAQMLPPMRITRQVQPQAMTSPRPGCWVFDMGQNMVGWCRTRVSAPRGTRLTLRHAERLNEDGTLDMRNLRSARATDEWICGKEGAQAWQPRFTSHGFRFVELSGCPQQPGLDAVTAHVIHTDMEQTGSFRCSDELVNRLHQCAVWGLRGNYLSIPTDCPQRDERHGWLGDRAAGSLGESYLFNVLPLYRKWLRDIRDSQREDGALSDVCPTFWPFYSGNITWPSAYVMIPGMLHQQYGDAEPIVEHYDAMVRWMAQMRGLKRDDGLIEADRYGDWCVPPEDRTLIHSEDPERHTPPVLLASAYYYNNLNLLMQYAAMLGREADVKAFSDEAETLKRRFHEQLFDSQRGVYGNGSQTSSVLPLSLGLVPAEHRRRLFDNLVEHIERRTAGGIGVGLVGIQWLLRVLTHHGRLDLAWQLACRRAYPGWGYMFEQGATTIWELWNGDTADPSMNSGNHVMLLGDLLTWLYQDLAGIRSDPRYPGFRHLQMRPQPMRAVGFVDAEYRSIRGPIHSAWRWFESRFHWDITLPAGTSATLWIPAESAEQVQEGGRSLDGAAGVSAVGQVEGGITCRIESGHYSFISRLTAPAP